MTIKINVYRQAGIWFGARWIDGEYDGCDERALRAIEVAAREALATRSVA